MARRQRSAQQPQSLEQAQRLLCEGEFQGLELIPWASNYTFAATLVLPDLTYVGVYKPRRGEIPLYDFPDGTLYRREVAAYRAARALGWDLIPITVTRSGPHGIGSLQLLVEADSNWDALHGGDQNEPDLQRLTLFDFLVNNADRKAGHILRGFDGHVWAIDHGLTFNEDPKLRTILWQHQGQAVPEEIVTELEEFATDPRRPAELRAELEQLLHPAEVEGFFERLDRVLALRRFPTPGARRHVPWPLY